MVGFLGMVPEQVEALADDLEARAMQVESIVQGIAARLQATTWYGADRDAFEGFWAGDLTSALLMLADALRNAGRSARSDAEQQRLAAT